MAIIWKVTYSQKGKEKFLYFRQFEKAVDARQFFNGKISIVKQK